MKVLLMAIAIFCFFIGTVPQNSGTITGRITIAEKGLEGSTITLLRVKDSVVVKRTISGKDGQFAIANINKGTYILLATMAGHEKSYSGKIVINPSWPINMLPSPIWVPLL